LLVFTIIIVRVCRVYFVVPFSCQGALLAFRKAEKIAKLIKESLRLLVCPRSLILLCDINVRICRHEGWISLFAA
jgi:hypothetical protein